MKNPSHNPPCSCPLGTATAVHTDRCNGSQHRYRRALKHGGALVVHQPDCKGTGATYVGDHTPVGSRYSAPLAPRERLSVTIGDAAPLLPANAGTDTNPHADTDADTGAAVAPTRPARTALRSRQPGQSHGTYSRPRVSQTRRGSGVGGLAGASRGAAAHARDVREAVHGGQATTTQRVQTPLNRSERRRQRSLARLQQRNERRATHGG